MAYIVMAYKVMARLRRARREGQVAYIVMADIVTAYKVMARLWRACREGQVAQPQLGSPRRCP